MHLYLKIIDKAYSDGLVLHFIRYIKQLQI